MTQTTDPNKTKPRAVVFGARNLAKAIIAALIAEGWFVAGAARSDSTLEGVAAAGRARPARG
jgi:hypothetical protein